MISNVRPTKISPMDKNKLERGIQRGLSEFQKVGPINGTLSQETPPQIQGFSSKRLGDLFESGQAGRLCQNI